MDELVKLVSQKTGIPEKTAAEAVRIVIDFLKDRLPAPIAAQVDNVLESGGKGKKSGGLSSLIK